MTRQRVLFLWGGVSGYMAACWRALLDGPYDLRIVAPGPAGGDNAPYLLDQFAGLPLDVLSRADHFDPGTVGAIARAHQPDVVVCAGWYNPAYCAASLALREERGSAVVLALDTRSLGLAKRWVIRRRHRRLLHAVSTFVVPGRDGQLVAQQLAGSSGRVATPLYGFDVEPARAAWAARLGGDWPPRFIFVGRHVAEKGVDVLAEAYRAYRRDGGTWELRTVGTGELEGLVRDVGGEALGFRQPADLSRLLATSGAMVLPSRDEPWGVALAEGAGAGLPLVATDRCGAAADVLVPGSNGVVVPAGSVQALASAMSTISNLGDDLRVWGERSAALAAPYGADVWAARWAELLDRSGMAST